MLALPLYYLEYTVHLTELLYTTYKREFTRALELLIKLNPAIRDSSIYSEADVASSFGAQRFCVLWELCRPLTTLMKTSTVQHLPQLTQVSPL